MMQEKCIGKIMEIETLIKQPESKTLEFKRDLSSLQPILKTIVAFANTAGGIIVIGCSTSDGIMGIKNVFKGEERLANTIADSIYPPLLPEIEIATLEGKDLLIIKVAHWKAPFYLKKEGVPKGVYIRLGSTSRPAGPKLLAELQRSVLSLSFDQQPLPDLSKESLDLEKIAQIFKARGKQMNKDKLQSLEILVSHAGKLVPSVGGFILFGKPSELHKFFPDARVSCARFLGDSKANILDRYEVEGTILDAVEAVPKFIARNTRLAAQIEGIRRKDIPEYPSVSIREALINALVHNDYSVQGSHIQIAIFDDRLEIQNPGMLPFGFTMEDLKSGVSKVRNRVIARVFHELQLMEVWGSGYKRCIEDCKLGNYPMPEWEESGAAIRVIFFPHQKTLIKNQKPSEKVMKELSARQRTILALFEPGLQLSFREIFTLLSKTISERTLRYDLAVLRVKNLLFCKGKGRAIMWQLNNHKE